MSYERPLIFHLFGPNGLTEKEPKQQQMEIPILPRSNPNTGAPVFSVNRNTVRLDLLFHGCLAMSIKEGNV